MSMIAFVTCPECGLCEGRVYWSGRCECHNCGNVWDRCEQHRKEMERRRQDFQKRNRWRSLCGDVVK